MGEDKDEDKEGKGEGEGDEGLSETKTRIELSSELSTYYIGKFAASSFSGRGKMFSNGLIY